METRSIGKRAEVKGPGACPPAAVQNTGRGFVRAVISSIRASSEAALCCFTGERSSFSASRSVHNKSFASAGEGF